MDIIFQVCILNLIPISFIKTKKRLHWPSRDHPPLQVEVTQQRRGRYNAALLPTPNSQGSNSNACRNQRPDPTKLQRSLEGNQAKRRHHQRQRYQTTWERCSHQSERRYHDHYFAQTTRELRSYQQPNCLTPTKRHLTPTERRLTPTKRRLTQATRGLTPSKRSNHCRTQPKKQQLLQSFLKR